MANSNKKKQRNKEEQIHLDFKRNDQVVFSQDGIHWGIGVYKEHESEDYNIRKINYYPSETPHRIKGHGWYKYCKMAKGFDQNRITKPYPKGY